MQPLTSTTIGPSPAPSVTRRVSEWADDLRLSVMDFNIEVKHRKHLADVIRRVRRLGVVNGVQRL